MFNGDKVSVQEGESFPRRMMVRAAHLCETASWHRTVQLNVDAAKMLCSVLCDFYHDKKKEDWKIE